MSCGYWKSSPTVLHDNYKTASKNIPGVPSGIIRQNQSYLTKTCISGAIKQQLTTTKTAALLFRPTTFSSMSPYPLQVFLAQKIPTNPTLKPLSLRPTSAAVFDATSTPQPLERVRSISPGRRLNLPRAGSGSQVHGWVRLQRR